MTTDVATMGASAMAVPASRLGDVEPNEVEPIRVHEIALRERNDAAADPEQAENRDMFARLRHDAFVSGDDEEREIDAGRAGEHRAHERLVAGNVDDAGHTDVRQVERREPEVDRDAASLLFRQSIGVDAGQCTHERGLAVVNVAGGANDHGASLDRRAPAVPLPDVVGPQRTAVGEMLGQELAQESLVRAPRQVVGETAPSVPADPGAQRRACVGGSSRLLPASDEHRRHSTPPAG